MMFTHLHVHSTYSLLDGMAKPEELVIRAKDLGFEALGLTDHGSITGHIQFLRAARKHDLKPILGIETYFVDNVTVKKKEEVRYHICLFAKNDTGWHNLCRLMSEAHQNFYYKPRIDLDLLDKYHDGLIVSTACMKGLISHPFHERLITNLDEIFKENIYLEMMPIKLKEQSNINGLAHYVYVKTGIPFIVTNDVHYLKEEDSVYHNFLLELNTGGKLQFNIQGLFLKSEQEMKDWCKEYRWSSLVVEQAFENGQFLVDSCYYDLPEKDLQLPSLADDPDERLVELAKIGTNYKFPPSGFEEYVSRLIYELDIVKQKQFSNYFLLVADLVRWARMQGFELGAGRGSAGGSLLCYCLGITDIDPIRHNLLFERFLNPDRTDYPDIDLDFPQSRRHEIVAYLKQKYGEDKVANISTLTELKLKGAFKDVCRHLDVPFVQANDISELLEGFDSMTSAIEKYPDLKYKLSILPKGNKIAELTDGITGTFRQGGTHAAGIVISPDVLIDNAVMEKRTNDLCVNWEMDDVGFFGWVKVDVLALRSLDVISRCKELIWDRHGLKIDWSEVNVEVEKNFREFGKGHTVGMFQFESQAMTSLCKSLYPITDKDTLIDINALGRPGPLDSGMTASYVDRYQMTKEGRKYLDHKRPYAKYTRELAKSTYNVIIYQEQIMQIAVDLAGYSIAESDTLRKVVAKSKGLEEFEKHRKKFLQGCKEKTKMYESEAVSLFEDLGNYSRYSFNKSHAAAYTELALRQMYLKINYPLEYMAALYICTPEEKKRDRFTEECNRLGIKLLHPDINKSDSNFTISGKDLLIGFNSIKGIGASAINAILEQRKVSPFETIESFRIRLPRNKVNKRHFESLILAGAFESLGVNTRVALDNLEYFNHLLDWDQSNGGSNIPVSLYDKSDDFEEDQLGIGKQKIMPGVYKVQIEPILGLTLPQDRLQELRQEIGVCEDCDLVKHYHCPVPFEYSPSSRLMVIGEAPGKEENELGRPFVGKAGEKMENDIEKVGLSRPELYITNVFKCRPLNNVLPANPPTICYKWIEQEFDLLLPKFVVAFGNSPLRMITGKKGGIMAMSGRITTETIFGRSISVLWCIHPAAVLRRNPEMVKLWRETVKVLKGVVKDGN